MNVYETKECKKEDLDRAGAAAASAAAAVEHESKAKAALARTVDILISTKKKVKFTQIHGSSFSIAMVNSRSKVRKLCLTRKELIF
jgi:3-oxoacyl-ACP reductase-like protein